MKKAILLTSIELNEQATEVIETPVIIGVNYHRRNFKTEFIEA